MTHGNTRHGHARKGGETTKTYRAWQRIRNDCLNPKAQNWQYYGGRGIAICERWATFENFLADMGEAPEGLELDRIDNNGNYEPGNCRWATRSQQTRNQNRPSTTGLKGVSIRRWRRSGEIRYYIAYADRNERGWLEALYHGRDFFEACCARKSWEAKQAYLQAAKTPTDEQLLEALK